MMVAKWQLSMFLLAAFARHDLPAQDMFPFVSQYMFGPVKKGRPHDQSEIQQQVQQ